MTTHKFDAMTGGDVPGPNLAFLGVLLAIAVLSIGVM